MFLCLTGVTRPIKASLSVYTHQKLYILIYSKYYHTPKCCSCIPKQRIMSQTNQIWWSFQVLKKHLQAEPLRANIIFVCFHEIFITLWHHDLLQLGIDLKKYAGLEFRSTFVFISLKWFVQTRALLRVKYTLWMIFYFGNPCESHWA